MNKSLQLRRGNTAQHSTFTGLSGELSINTDDYTIILHDGATPGGIPIARRDYVDTQLNLKVDISTTLSGYGITDAYTQTEVNTLLTDKANNVDVYTKNEIDAFNFSTVYDINNLEYVLNYKRGGLVVYGIEVNVGLLPDTNTITIPIPAYNAAYTYWISSESYASDGTSSIMLPHPDLTASDIVTVKIVNGDILVTTGSSVWASFIGNVVLNYTK